MTIRILAATAAAAAVAATSATAATTATATLKNCGAISAGGRTFHVSEVGLPGCPSARTLTKKLAGMGLHRTPPGRYRGTYLKMGCIGLAAKVGGKDMAQIQCASSDGRRLLVAVAKR